jgi:NAD(P)-dependent dehydrogenase (short-subunit alcohol dehydrogenase family)
MNERLLTSDGGSAPPLAKEPPMPITAPLAGHVAVVAGATRGAGRGIARALGEAGAIVYCTGRSVPGQPSPYGRPETIDETAALTTAAGGTGIAVRVDHSVEAEVEALFARVAGDHGRLDVLVNSVAGEDPILGGWGAFWETDLTRGADAFRQAILSHLITAKHAAPHMIKRRRGLIVEVTEGDTVFGGGGNAVADVVKCSLKGFAARMAGELAAHRVAAVSITPGFLRSEAMLAHFGVTEGNWRDAGKTDPNFLESESPLFVGRAVAALAADPKVRDRSGDVLCSWELAREYRFTDHDGRRPDWGAHFATILPVIGFLEPFRRHRAFLGRMTRRMDGYLEAADAAVAAKPRSARAPAKAPEKTAGTSRRRK